MKLGIVGLPNVGKSTLFNALTNAGAQAANYPFCTIEPNTGIVPVPDNRLDALARMFYPKKAVPATVEFVDIAGLVKDASKGEGLGNKFLSHIREVDALVHVVRCFDDERIIHVDGRIDPQRDIETIALELIFADLETVSRRIDKAQKMLKSGEKKYQTEVDIGRRLHDHLEAAHLVRTFSMTKEEREIVKSWFLLTDKPVVYAANVNENDVGKDGDKLPYVRQIKTIAEAEGAKVFAGSARIEEELSAMPPDDKVEFLQELNIGESSLNRLIRACYSLLGLISFFTIGNDECRAWTILNGTKAPQAAGKIHTDFERGFIRAETVAFKQLVSLGSMNACRESGLIRSEGKEYAIKDGDVVLFRFNV